MKCGDKNLIFFRHFIFAHLQDPYTYVDESGEDLPTVAAIKRVKLSVNPQVSNMIRQFDDDIADDPDEEDEDFAEEFAE